MAELIIPELGKVETRLDNIEGHMKSIEDLLHLMAGRVSTVERPWFSRPQFFKKEHMSNQKFQELVKAGKIECNDVRGGQRGKKYRWKEIPFSSEE